MGELGSCGRVCPALQSNLPRSLSTTGVVCAMLVLLVLMLDFGRLVEWRSVHSGCFCFGASRGNLDIIFDSHDRRRGVARAFCHPDWLHACVYGQTHKHVVATSAPPPTTTTPLNPNPSPLFPPTLLPHPPPPPPGSQATFSRNLAFDMDSHVGGAMGAAKRRRDRRLRAFARMFARRCRCQLLKSHITPVVKSLLLWPVDCHGSAGVLWFCGSFKHLHVAAQSPVACTAPLLGEFWDHPLSLES